MKIGVVIVNTNAWVDVLECLESLFRSEGVTLEVVVVDNASSDGSAERIRDWAAGRLDTLVPRSNQLHALSHPPIQKPIEWVQYNRAEAEAGGRPEVRPQLIVVQNEANLGFTGGNNVGLRYFLKKGEVEYVWLLNPDTVVEPLALARMVETAVADPSIGICGCTVRYYHTPGKVQVLGGFTYNRWLALPLGIGTGSAVEAPIDEAAVREKMAYVYGASMLVSRDFMREVGLFNEDLFLYFDELDWVLRAGKRFRLGYRSDSVVYHREGGNLGAGVAKSWNSDFYFMRNRIRITRAFWPRALPSVYVALLVAAARRAVRGRWDRVVLILRLLWSESMPSARTWSQGPR